MDKNYQNFPLTLSGRFAIKRILCIGNVSMIMSKKIEFLAPKNIFSPVSASQYSGTSAKE